jgi:N-acyl-L-homoserine lactone synthetase
VDQALERLDSTARRILRGIAPLTVERTSAPEDVLAAQRLRFAAAVEMGWARPESMPDGIERDDDDDRAVVLVCRDGARIAGCARLVVPMPGRPLPTERDFGLTADPEGTASDLGRLVVSPGHRGMRSPVVILGLLARGWLETRALGMRRILASAPPELIELYRTLGIRLTELGPPRRHRGAERVPVELAGVEDLPAFADDEPVRPITRRSLLVGGAAAAGGALVVGVPPLAALGRAPRTVGAGPTDRTTIGLIAQIDQVGRELTALGRLTRVRGLPIAALTTGPPGVSSSDPAAADLSAARFTVVARCTIASLSVLGSSITAIAAGRISVHFLPQGGARADDPASFSPGRAIATFEGTFQNDLALDSPDNASTSLLAGLSQRSARAFTLSGRRHRLGRAGLAWTLRASGRGRRLEPTAPRSQLFMSGDMTVGDDAAI